MTAPPIPPPPTVDDLRSLAARSLGIPVRLLGPLTGGGSQRALHRLEAAGQRVVGAIGADLPEVRAFLGFTRHFAARGIPVPRILGEDATRGLYLMEDLGEATLAQRLAAWRAERPTAPPVGADAAHTALEAALETAPETASETAPETALETVVRWLPVIQVRGGVGLDDSLCWEGRALDAGVFRRDVERFLRHYLPRFGLHPAPLDDAVRGELDTLIARLDALPREHFCYRDFQSRNVMWVHREGEAAPGPVFLDYQSGRRGPLAYDLASLLYSPDTGADEPLRERLIGVYLSALAGQGVSLDRTAFLAGFRPIVLLRRLQALGRYAELGAVHKRAAFLDKIPPALAELRALRATGRLDFGLPALEAWLGRVLAE